MISLERKLSLAASLESQILDFRAKGDALPPLVDLLIEYTDRAHGLAELRPLHPDAVSDTAGYAMIVIGARTLLREFQERHAPEELPALDGLYRALSAAVVTPSASSFANLRDELEALSRALRAARSTA